MQAKHDLDLILMFFMYILIKMKYEWDEAKNTSNQMKHGVDMSCAETFDWNSCLNGIDARQNYKEERFVATGYLGGRLHVLTYTWRKDTIRVISLRKANIRERIFYEKSKKTKLD